MPNWCTNYVDIEGPTEQLLALDAQFKQHHTSYFGYAQSVKKSEFNPERYKGCLEYRTSSQNRLLAFPGNDGEERIDVSCLSRVIEEDGYSFNNFILMTRDDFLNGWYEWSRQNWGTKWDLNSNEIYCSLDHMPEGEQIDALHYIFDTAWSPPSPVIEAMAKVFPELKFKHSYYDEGEAFAGIDRYAAGEIKESEEAENSDFREFMFKQGFTGYVKCTQCGNIMSEYEVVDENEACDECGGTEFCDTDGSIINREDDDKCQESGLAKSMD